MAVYETDLLSRLIHQKLDCLTRLRDMGRKQLDLVREGSITELLDVLSVKQRVLLELQGIEKSLGPFRHQDPEQRRWRTPDARQRCAQDLRQCELLLGEIMAQEKQSENDLIRRRDETALQLQGVHRAAQARGAYVTMDRGTHNELDLSSEVS
jgi:hypothetical protein